MRGRIRPGVAGWLAALTPLIIANLVTYLGYLSFDESVLAGTLGLVGSIALGGLVSGMVGARGGRGALGAAASGGITAGLYVVSVIALNTGTSLHDSSAPQIITNPVPAIMTVLFCASLLLGVALITGAISASRRPPTPARQQPARMPVDRATVPLYGARARPPQFPQPPRAAPPTVPRSDWPPSYARDPRTPYDGDDHVRMQSRRPADVISRPSVPRSYDAGRDHNDDRR